MSFFQTQIVKMLTDMLRHVDAPAFILDGQSARVHGWNTRFAELFPNPPVPDCQLSDLLPNREVIDWLRDYYQQKYSPDENWRPSVWTFMLEGLADEAVNARLEILHFGEKTGLLVVSLSIVSDWLAGAEPNHLGTLIYDFTGSAAFMDKEGRFQIANQPMSEFLKLPMSDIINRSFMDVFPDDISWPLETIFHTAISSGQDQLEEMETKAGRDSVWLQVMFNVVRKNGEIVGAYFSAQDTRRLGASENEDEGDDDFFGGRRHGGGDEEDDFFNMGAGGDGEAFGSKGHLQDASQMAQILQDDGDNFEAGLRRALAFLGEGSEADRVGIWQFHKSPFSEDEELYISQLYEWSENCPKPDGAMDDSSMVANRPVSEAFPDWVERFRAGQCVSGLVQDAPARERALLEGQGLLSILVAPIASRNGLWGLIGFGGCRSERLWTPGDEKILLAAGTLLGTAIQNRDVTEALDDARQNMENLNVQLEQANHAKGEFLANMSHEIRTPMNAVLGMINLVMDTELSDYQRVFLEKADFASKTLLRIINDILDFSKIEAGRMEIEACPYDLGDVLSGVSDMLSERVRQKGLDFKIKLAEGLPGRYIGDALRLGQVLINLLTNAIKFTDEGGSITLTVKPAPDSSLAFSVADTGIGLSPENLKKLFTPFSQADSSITRRYGGTGLGLALCRALVSLMGGEIGCESEQGRGATFHFTIQAPPAAPLLTGGPTEAGPETAAPEAAKAETAAPEKAGPETAKAPSLAERVAGMRVLLAEDNELNQLLVKELLRKVGLELTVVGNGLEAIEKLKSEPFDLVLMDVQMPEMDGLTATGLIREDPRFAELPIVAMTAHAMSGDRERTLAAGMNDYLAKPLVAKELFECIIRWKEKKESTPQGKR